MGTINVSGQVGIPTGYFLRMAKHDYESYRDALPREFYQNSADAGARNIWITFDNEKRSITITDDGCGMDLNVLQNKLLVLGGSHKKSGSTGAFGKAKELLFFSWESYEIETNGLYCVGQGAEYEISGEENPKLRGTACTIVIPEEEDFSEICSKFTRIAKRFEIDASIYVQGELVKADLLVGNMLSEMQWGTIYAGRTETSDVYYYSRYFQIRVNGQWMFSRYHGNDKIGSLIIELSKHSAEILTSNRDGIKSEFSNTFSNVLREIMVDREKFFNPRKKIVREKITGKGAIKINFEKFKEALRQSLKDFYNLVAYSADEIKGRLSSVMDVKSEANAERIKSIQQGIQAKPIATFYDIQDRLSFIGYEPDFILLYDDGAKPKDCEDFIFNKRFRILAHLWTEIVKQVLIDVDWYGDMVCGFNYSESALAMHEVIDSIHHFYLNPDTIDIEVTWVKDLFKNKALLKKVLVRNAIHEVTHVFEKYHDSDFLQKQDWVTVQTWKSEKIYNAIMRDAFNRG